MNKDFALTTSVKNNDIREFRNKTKLSRKELASFLNVSVKTIESWENMDKEISGPVVPLLTILSENSELIERYRMPKKEYPLRLFYMNGFRIGTVIDIDMVNKKVKFKNFTDNLLLRAFGSKEIVSFNDFEHFLESRCFPSTRDKIKIELETLELKSYDPISIIRKTNGRMAEDNNYILIEK